MIKLFTHTDLDGIGCSIVLKHLYGKNDVDVSYCSYKDIDDTVQQFIDDSGYIHYDQVYITDISVSREICEQIKNIHTPVRLIDHHKTVLDLNHFSFAHVFTHHKNGKLSSGTSLLVEFLREQRYLVPSGTLDDFAEIVRRYDTWDWHRYKDQEPKDMNTLFYAIGKEEFEKFWLKVLHNSPASSGYCSSLMPADYLAIIQSENRKEESYISAKLKSGFNTEIHGYQAFVCFAEQYFSMLGNQICERYPRVDVAMMINADKESISFRSTKDNVDVGEFSKKYFGGGGHKHAAGAPIESLKRTLIDAIVSKDYSQKSRTRP